MSDTKCVRSDPPASRFTATPAGPIACGEVLEIGQGRPSSEVKSSTIEREKQARRLEAMGQETGGAFARIYPELVLRSDVVEEKARKAAQVEKGKEKEKEQAQKLEEALQKKGHDDGPVSGEKDKEVDEAALALASHSIKEEKSEQLGVSFHPEPLRVHRKGGALTSEASSSREVEVYNELLLIALGLGQYRSLEDGATMVFENEAIFGDEALASSTSKIKTPATSQSTPDPSPAGLQAELAYQQQQRKAGLPDSVPSSASASAPAKTWGSFSKWADNSIKSVGNLFPPAVPEAKGTHADAASPTQSSGSAGAPGDGKKARQQPSEFCHYDARARAMIFVAANALGLSDSDGQAAEKILAQTIYFIMKDAQSAAAKQGKDPLKHAKGTAAAEEDGDSGGRTSWMNRVSQQVLQRPAVSGTDVFPSFDLTQAGTSAVAEHGRSNWKRWAAAGGGAAIGAGIIGLTGGLAAPLVLPALASLSGVALFASSGGIVLAAALFGIGGGGLAGYRVSRRLRGLESFEFKEVDTQARLAGMSIPSLHATICVSGIILEESQQLTSWQGVWASSKSRDVYIVSSEAKLMAQAGVDLRGYVFTYMKRALGQKAAEEAIKRTALAAFTALTLPLTVANTLGTALDSTFVRAKSKAYKKGLVLAEVLRAEVQGHRPVVLMGASLGCITILTALGELAKDPEANSHLVDSVFLIGAPATPGRRTLTKARSIVGRRFVNAFSSKDMVCSVAAWLGMELSAEEIADGRAPRVMGSGPTWGVPGVSRLKERSGIKEECIALILIAPSPSRSRTSMCPISCPHTLIWPSQTS